MPIRATPSVAAPPPGVVVPGVTVTTQEAVFPPLWVVTVIVVVPTERAFTIPPLMSTVATAGLLLDQDTTLLDALLGDKVMAKVIEFPTAILVLFMLRVTPVTGTTPVAPLELPPLELPPLELPPLELPPLEPPPPPPPPPPPLLVVVIVPGALIGVLEPVTAILPVIAVILVLVVLTLVTKVLAPWFSGFSVRSLPETFSTIPWEV